MAILGHKWLKRLGIWIVVGVILLLLLIVGCNFIVTYSAEENLYSEVLEIPENRVGLLLGTSPKLRGGKPNLYFNYRIDAAVSLFQAGKIRKILVSGDNRRQNYNEPMEMRKALLAHGIPDSVIVLDYVYGLWILL